MKSLIAFAFFLVGSAALAQDCFQATNPEWAVVQQHDENYDRIVRTEKATSVLVRIIEANPADENAGPATLEMVATTPSMKFATTAFRVEQRDPNTYGVECDGGTLKLHVSRIGYTAVTDRLAGEITSADEGCNGNGTISFPQLVLQRVQCL